MKESELLRRYGLALALVPDADAAGDLFMDCHSDAALLRRVNRWRRAKGIAPVRAADFQPVTLSAEQQMHARHLARRGRVRRLFRMALGAASACLLLAVAGVAFLQLQSAALPGDPVYAGQPVDRSDSSGGVRLSVFKAEASAGAVTVWWEVTGPGVTGAEGDVALELTLSGSGADWVLPALNQTARPRPDRIIGRSTYTAIVGDWQAAVLHLRELRDRPLGLLAKAPLQRVAHEAGARLLRGAAAVQGDYRFTLQQLVVAPTYTLVSYQASHPDPAAAVRHYLRLEAEGGEPHWLAPVGPPSLRNGTVQAIFQAVPAGSTAVTLHFDLPGPGEILSLPQAGEVTGIAREGLMVTVQLALSTHLWDPTTVAVTPLPDWPWRLEGSHLADGQGGRYPVSPVYQGEDPTRHLTLWRMQAAVPSTVEIGGLRVWLARIGRVRGPQISVKL